MTARHDTDGPHGMARFLSPQAGSSSFGHPDARMQVFPKFESYTPSFRGEAVRPRARNPVTTDRGLLDSGLAARSQVYAGCVNLPALAPRNDKFCGISLLPSWRKGCGRDWPPARRA